MIWILLCESTNQVLLYSIAEHTFDFVERTLLFISEMGSEGILKPKGKGEGEDTMWGKKDTHDYIKAFFTSAGAPSLTM